MQSSLGDGCQVCCFTTELLIAQPKVVGLLQPLKLVLKGLVATDPSTTKLSCPRKSFCSTLRSSRGP